MTTPIHPSSIQYWPGGIPACIECHPIKQLTEEEEANGDWDFPTSEETIEESKGWLLFVEEQWVAREKAGVPNGDQEYELRQRRALVEKWASADQPFRDSFHNRATPRESAVDYPSAAREHLEDTRQEFSSWIWHPEPNGKLLPTMVKPNPARFPDPNTFTIADFPMWALVETADFRCISISRGGKLLLERGIGPYFIIDQASLETGRFSIIDYKSTGHINRVTLRRPYFLTELMNYARLGFDVDRMEEDNMGGRERYENQPMDMDLPILDIIQTAKDNSQITTFFDTERDQWEKDIELYAPGYLAMEAEGRASEYDVRNLRNTEDAERIRYSE